jgi:gliding motility-associated-like protein
LFIVVISKPGTMKSQTGPLLRIVFAVLLLITTSSGRVAAQVLLPSDVVVTYNGDPAQPVAHIKKIGDPAGSSANLGQNWASFTTVTNWRSDIMGQVFGTAIDNAGNVYFGATAMYARSLFSANVVSLGIGPSWFHASGGAAGIYKADNANLNTVTALVTTGSGGLGTSQIVNAGYGIGDVAFNKTANCLYATNLDDGKIYKIDLPTGIVAANTSVFDPMAADASGPAIAPYGERVFAVGVNEEFDGTIRVYYSLLVNNFISEIRSVQVAANGDFLPLTDVLEFTINTPAYSKYVSDLAFSVRGELIIAEKGNPHDAAIYEFFGRHNAWSQPLMIPSGKYQTNTNSGGGVDFGEYDGASPATCDSLMWFTANAIVSPGGSWYYGLQSAPNTGYVNPGGVYLNEAYIADLRPGLSEYIKGGFGDVEVYDSPCDEKTTDICGLVSASASSSPIEPCCISLRISNQYQPDYFSGILVETQHLNINAVTAGSTWGNINYQSPTSVFFSDTISHSYIPRDTAAWVLAKLCFSGTGNDVLIVRWIGNAPQYDTVCVDTVVITPCGVPVDTTCAAVLDPQVSCKDGIRTMSFQIKNNSSFTMRGVTLYPLTSGVTPVTSFVPIADLAPGQTSAVYSVTLNVSGTDTNACFYFSACDLNVPPGTSGQYPEFCCMDSIEYCVTIPACDPCESLTLTAAPTDASGKCCYKLSLTNNLTEHISCIRFRGQSGAQFALFSGWNIQPPVSSNDITICAPGGGIGNGSFADFANFCLTGTSTSPHHITVDFLNDDGTVVCTKELIFECELVPPTCANIVDDSLYCEGHETKFSFHIKNNSPFTIYQVEVRTSDSSIGVDQNVIIVNPAIPPGGTGGPYIVGIDSGFVAEKDFCVYLTAHNSIYNPDSGIAATQCCTDSLGVICLPFIPCTEACCDFIDLGIPTGLTPNGDAFNESYEIQNAALCEHISIVVYNRWGNIVYEEKHYKNNWKGTNNKNEALPQGTYFVVIGLPNGSKKGTYVDIRY